MRSEPCPKPTSSVVSPRFSFPGTSGLDDAALFTHQAPPQRQLWNECIDELLDMLSLEDDWDGEGAKAPPKAIVGGAIRLALVLREGVGTGFPFDGVPSRVVPGVTGTVIFEWQKNGFYCEIEVIDSNHGHVVTMGDDRSTESFEVEW